MVGTRRVRPNEDGADEADGPAPRVTAARRNAAIGAVSAVAQAVAVAPPAAGAAAAAADAAADDSKYTQKDHEAKEVRDLTKTYSDARVVEAADFEKHGIVAPTLRVALICKACVRVRGDKTEYRDERRQAKVYVARRFAHEAAQHFETCHSRMLEREYNMRQAAGVSPSPTPTRGAALSRPQQQQQQQDKLLARLSHWFVEHNVSLMAVTQFGKDFGAKLGESLLPLNIDWSRRLQLAAKESYDATLARTIQMPYTCLAFDGGKWQHTGRYMLICTATNPNGVMVLPPATQDAAWNSESTAKVISQHRLTLQGTTIKHAVVDGAAYNGAAVDGMNYLAEIIHGFGDNPLSAHVPGLMPHENDFVDAVGTVLRGAAYGCIKQVLCLGHWVKNRVVQAQSKETASYKFLLAIERSLYGGDDDQSTRRTLLTSRIRALRARAKEDGLAAIDEAIQALQVLFNPGALIVTVQWRSAVAAQVRKAFGPKAAADTDGGTADAAAADPAAGVGFDDQPEEDRLMLALYTSPHWKEDAAKLLGMLTEMRAIAQGESTAALTATVNQTRWHTSTYLAYVFAAQNLPFLKQFYDAQTSTPQSVKDIQAALGDAVKKAEIEQQILEYTTTMAPASRFLEAASENSPGLVMRMYPLLNALRDEFLEQPAGSVGHICGSTIRDALHFPLGDQNTELSRTVSFFAYAHFLVPGVFVTLGEVFLGQADLSVRKARRCLGFDDAELPEGEWDDFVAFQRRLTIPSDALSFWQGPRSDRWPQLRKIALYLYSAPAVVTTCDSIISVMGNMFSSRQTRLADSTAADLVAWRCNGHPDFEIDGSIRRNSTMR